ncbi:MAG: acylphosphatase [Candidatus Hydrogenedentes bacterium]|nr:acylphosphatase [Candidatus Hydrogenedentota bacterium]
MPAIRQHLLIEGRVQGVGFRYAAFQRATALGLSGWVRNLPGGRVEALIEGEEASVNAMIAWCQKGPAFAQVRLVRVNPAPDSPPSEGFSIR